ncbi:glycosyltransferase family 2 protein [Flavobacterium flavigenum]|uniref:glycosyltransferase family 2 protein n=1 Tax=Flavobacterium flavigenum TaxID=3003258 RepID=UPI0024828B52|nr:glycosyltransferase family 2 protein [Flavobacterium flavigenum]
MNSQLVTIIIPTYNRGHLLGETLDSIVNQTYENWECIIVDDGSDDNTEETVNGYLHKDKRFRYYQRPVNLPKGGNSCRNYGFELSKGAYIKWFDSDDIMYCNFLDKQVDIMQTNPNLDFCACQWEYFQDNLSTVKNYINLKPSHHTIYSYFLDSHVFITQSPLWKKQFLKGKELFDLKLFRGQEADFHFRMLTYSPKYLLHEDFLYKVRRGHDSIESLSNNKKAQLSVLRYFLKAFKILRRMKFERKKELLRYLIFRITRQMFIVILEEKNFFKRLRYLIYYKNIFQYNCYIKFKHIIKLKLGLFFLIFFKVGDNLMNLKCYDYRAR